MSESRADEIRARLDDVRARVEAATARAGRAAAEVSIVAVTKRHGPEVAEAAHAAGLRAVGESYVQELLAKREQVGCDLAWHFIGRLQRNKVKAIAGQVALVHAVDSLALAQEIDRRTAERPGAAPQRVLLAVNVGGEAHKSGVLPGQAAELLAAMAGLGHVACVGLMTMPPLAGEPEHSRPHFRSLAALRARLADASGLALPELSMGTSGDYEVAVEEGATLVRIGAALVGARPT